MHSDAVADAMQDRQTRRLMRCSLGVSLTACSLLGASDAARDAGRNIWYVQTS